MTDIATCYQGRDNTFTLVLKKNDVTLTPEEMDVITKFEIHFRRSYYNSVTTPAAFIKNREAGSVTIKPQALGLIASEDIIELIIYDAGDYTHGLVWGTFQLIIKEDALP